MSCRRPRLAAVTSFLSFALGALLPVLPYLFGATSMGPALVLTLLGLFLCGAFVTRLTPRPWWFGGARQVLVGAVAATVTYGFGVAVGAGISCSALRPAVRVTDRFRCWETPSL